MGTHQTVRIGRLAPRVWNFFHHLTQLSTKFQLLIKTKIPSNEEISYLSRSDVVFIMLINCWHFNIYEQDKFRAQLSRALKKLTSGPGHCLCWSHVQKAGFPAVMVLVILNVWKPTKQRHISTCAFVQSDISTPVPTMQHCFRSQIWCKHTRRVRVWIRESWRCFYL